MPAQAKARRSDYVIGNEGSLETLEIRTDALWAALAHRVA
jgi:hypothetical protein